MEKESLEYSVSAPKPQTHYFHVNIRVPSSLLGKDEVRFEMPVWTPGSYLVREFAKNILEFKVRDSSTGAELPVTKVAKNAWIVRNEKGTKYIEANYTVYAHELTVNTSYLDDEHGIINGASVFMYVKGLEKNPIILSVSLPDGWAEVSSGLPRIDQNKSKFLAKDFDLLVDSPMEIGNQSSYLFDVASVPHEVSIFGLNPSDHGRFVEDLRKIVENTWPIFGELPFQNYLFLVDFSAEHFGGLEHLNSTHCIAQRLRTHPPEEYRLLLSLFSHEYFHAWNVKRMRPIGLGPFDYSSEAYTKSLWIAEGITSYYDNLILRRANIFSVGEYLDAFVSDIDILLDLPGSKWQSAEESSFDSWIKYYRPDENSPNSVSSYYIQGTIIGWMIDMEIRKLTANTRTLDDALRKIYTETYKKENRGFTDQEFEEACNAVAGQSLAGKIFDRRVRGRQTFDFENYLSYSGLELKPKQKPRKGERELSFLGVKLKNESGRTIVANRLFDSPAEESGLSAGDEVIGADGQRFDLASLVYYLSNKSPGEEIKILASRDGALKEIYAKLVTKPVLERRIYKAQSASEAERKFFEKWLLQDWNSEIEYPEFTKSPLRKNLVDYI